MRLQMAPADDFDLPSAAREMQAYLEEASYGAEEALYEVRPACTLLQSRWCQPAPSAMRSFSAAGCGVGALPPPSPPPRM